MRRCWFYRLSLGARAVRGKSRRVMDFKTLGFALRWDSLLRRIGVCLFFVGGKICDHTDAAEKRDNWNGQLELSSRNKTTRGLWAPRRYREKISRFLAVLRAINSKEEGAMLSVKASVWFWKIIEKFVPSQITTISCDDRA